MIPLLARATSNDPGFAVICVVAGLFAIVAAWKNWDWFFAFQMTRLFVAILGRAGARILYVILGCFLIACGIVIGS